MRNWQRALRKLPRRPRAHVGDWGVLSQPADHGEEMKSMRLSPVAATTQDRRPLRRADFLTIYDLLNTSRQEP
jgi:hypothetical protein